MCSKEVILLGLELESSFLQCYLPCITTCLTLDRSLPLVLFFFFTAGIYLGFLYVIRGFGIAAATHAAYDVVATTLLASSLTP